MNSKHKREYTKENYLSNGHKTQNQWSRNRYTTTTKEPGTNESRIEAQNNGF